MSSPTPITPEDDWLDELLAKARLTDVYGRNEQVIMIDGDLSSAVPLSQAILKHQAISVLDARIDELKPFENNGADGRAYTQDRIATLTAQKYKLLKGDI